MNVPELPDFNQCLALANGSLNGAELAECHGVLCGVLSVSPNADSAEFLSQLRNLELLEDPDEALVSVLDELFIATTAQLDDDAMSFRLWLPDDEDPLEQRTDALAHWCTGFLAGLATRGDLDGLQGETEEAVRDLEQIARAGISAGDDEDGRSRDEDERDFLEIAEYVRIVTMILREDFRGPEQGEPIH